MNKIAFVFFSFYLVNVVSFLQTRYNYNVNNNLQLNARRKVKEIPDEVASFTPGLEIPEEIKNQNAIYDMFLVERLSAPEKTDFGLFLPKVEGKDKKQIGIVLSVPKGYGLESEQGRVQSIEEICPTVKVGDTVFIRDPWGIGTTFFIDLPQLIYFLLTYVSFFSNRSKGSKCGSPLLLIP